MPEAAAGNVFDDWVFAALGLRVGSGTPDPAEDAYQREHAALEPRVLEAMRADPEQRSAISARWSSAQEMAGNGDFARALTTLTRLAELVDGVLKAAEGTTQAERLGIEPGLVATRRAEIEAMLEKNIADSKGIVVSDVAAFAPGLNEVVENPQDLITAMNDTVSSLYGRIESELGKAAKTGDVAALRGCIEGLQAEIAGDKRLAAIGEAAEAFQLDDPRETIGAMFEEALAGLESVAA